MFIEIHMLQNFAPSNLNRDDTNAPKDCEFGGYRRARISSQCIKRAIREEFATQELLPPANRASRTRRLLAELVNRLTNQGKDEVQAQQVGIAAIQGIGLDFSRESDPENPQHVTEYLLFLAESEIQRFADLCLEHWDDLLAVGEQVAPADEEQETGRRAAKRARKASLPKDVHTALQGVLDGGRASDLGLFGRMIADLPAKRIDAASQVAHAISTNQVAVEFDFYTAVDDFNPDDQSGAGMMGTVEFNSACFYRYANVDLSQLAANLGGDEDLARATLGAFLKASVLAVPTGKQNSMAAQNPPSFVLVVARDSGLWSMANAYLQPVRPNGAHDLVDESIERLDDYWGRLARMYGDDGIHGVWYVSLGATDLTNLAESDTGNFNALVEHVLAAAEFGHNGAGGLA
jgi:CRISPR system Cascade subunit CasC